MYKLLSMLLLLFSMFQEVLPMRNVAQRSLLRSAQNYKVQITRAANLQRMPRRNLTGFEPVVIAGTANPVVVPLAMCCIGTGVACKIAWELYWYGSSETYKRLFGPKQHLHSEIDMHLRNISGIHGEKHIEPWQEGLPTWMISQDLYSENQSVRHSLPGEGGEWIKLKGDQGWRDSDGNIWKKDQFHKDHWDVSDRKGNKIREVDFNGKELWPNGPKNKNK
jgi:hypothetical protein